MPSHRLAKLEIENLEIIGYSVAGEESVVAIPVLDVCFDIGKAPDQTIPINNVLLTHGHIDHTAGVAYHLSHRKFCGIDTGNVLVPAHLEEPLKQILQGWGKLDGNQIPANIIPVKPGDEYKVKPNLIARVFPTKHCKGSVGYTIIEKRKKLKDEFKGLSGPEIVKLKKQGTAIDYPVEIPLVTYLGDTQNLDYSSLEYVSNSKILIAECTFFIPEHNDRSVVGKHLHVDNLDDMLAKLNCKHFLLTHLTQRTPITEAMEILKTKLSPDVLEKTTFLMDRKNPHRK